jgi:thiol-disulfide isomerase/thioredoxin
MAAALLAYFGSAASAAEPARVTVPDFSAPLVGGGTLNDEMLRGKWTVVQFWGLWCEDSLADADHSAALARAIAQDPGLSFYTIHVDQRFGRWGSVDAFFAEEGVSFPVALDPHRRIKNAFGVTSTPTYLVIDPDGVIRATRGDLRKDESGEGGVKAFIKQIAELRRSH